MILNESWRRKSLEVLEQQNWGDPTTAPTNLVKRRIELSKVPIEAFTLSDLRLMIGQQIGLPFLILIAIEKLRDNIFIEADYYEGDLLSAVLNVTPEYWINHKEQWLEIKVFINGKRSQLTDKDISSEKFDSVIRG